MNKRQPIIPNDPDLLGATAALKRAARHARELAEQTGTPCWVMRNGRIVEMRRPARKLPLRGADGGPSPDLHRRYFASATGTKGLAGLTVRVCDAG